MSNVIGNPSYSNYSGAIVYTCSPDWQCGSWSTCVGNLQTRTCTDSNSCGLNNSKPSESTICGSGSGSLLLINQSREAPLLQLLGEPITCGDGNIGVGESYLNCNKDVPPTLVDYVKCVSVGREECIYYNQYSSIVMVLAAVGVLGAIFIFSAKGGATLSSFNRVKKSSKSMTRVRRGF
jgi:hypothetical protein